MYIVAVIQQLVIKLFRCDDEFKKKYKNERVEFVTIDERARRVGTYWYDNGHAVRSAGFRERTIFVSNRPDNTRAAFKQHGGGERAVYMHARGVRERARACFPTTVGNPGVVRDRAN